jgi:outer membrane protein
MASLEDVGKIKNDISLSIALAYLQILLNIELLEVANNQLEITNQQIMRTSQLVEAGSLPQGNLLEIQAQAAAEELQQVNAQNQLDISYLTLTQLLELDSVGDFEIEIPDLPLPEESFLLESVKDIYSDAERILPQVKSADYQLKSSEVGLDIAKGARIPRLSFTGSYGTRYSNILKSYDLVEGELTDPFPIGTVDGTGDLVYSLPQPLVIGGDYPFGNQFSDNATYGVQFNLTIPIFNGWQTNTMISNAKISVLNSKYNLEYTKKSPL